MTVTSTDNPTPPLAVPATEAARMCGFSRSGWWKLHSKGMCPRPIRLGRKTLWAVDGPNGLRAWVAAGCPSLDKWEAA